MVDYSAGMALEWVSVGGDLIEGDDGEDYFLHISKVRKGQKVADNSRVKFDYREGQRGREAENVAKRRHP